MEKIIATNYLTVDNVARYRKIMRFFYVRHRQMQGTLYRPEILQMMQDEFSTEYSESEVDQDLESLVEWGNLQRQQEFIRPKSIEEYRNKNFRYQISEEGILVEEMVYQLTHQKKTAQGALDEKGFFNLLRLLEELVDEKEITRNPTEVWEEIRTEFLKIQGDTSNYIGYITSPEVDSRMKTEQFLVYKDRFVNYLRDFISTVQQLYYPLVSKINQLDKVDFDQIAQDLYEKELEKTLFDEIKLEDTIEQLNGERQAFIRWFIGSEERESEYSSLMAQTEQMIAKITGLIYYFGQEVKQYRSRKKDYLKIAKWFSQADSLDEVKKMYGAIFGLEHSRHFHVPSSSTATHSKEISWELAPGIIFLNKRGRGAIANRKAQTVKLSKKQQDKQLQDYLKQEDRRQKQIASYFKNDEVDFSKIKQLDKASRKVFLKWISEAIVSKEAMEKGQTIATELGYRVTIMLDKSQRVSVACEDGILEMPAVIIRREASE